MIVIIFGLYILCPLVIIIVNAMAMVRHRTNKPCALAIVTAMLAVMTNAIANIGSGATHIGANTLAILVYTAKALTLLSMVLSVVGINQCFIRKRYVRGRWRAVIALLVTSGYTYQDTVRIIEGVNIGIAWTQLLRTQSTGGKPVVNETWNFRVTPPPSWDEVSTEAFPLARAAFKFKKGEMFTLIYAEDLPEGSELTLADYMDIQKKFARENAKDAEFLNEEELKEGSFTVRTLEMRGHELINPMFHVFWVLRDGHTMYRIATWGLNANAKEVREQARKMLRGFDLIERRDKPNSTPKPTVAAL